MKKFISQHCNAFVSIQQCDVHVKFQLPNEYSRVGYLLDAIKRTDASLQASMALVCNDDDPATGKRSDFKVTATCLLPHDTMAKKHNKKPYCHRGAEIYSIDYSNIKSEVGTRGVFLRYHKRNEHLKLTS